MIRSVAPQFFTSAMQATLDYYSTKLGFTVSGVFGEPPVYAMVCRDGQFIHFRTVDRFVPDPGKYQMDWLDAYCRVEDAGELYREYQSQGVEFHQELCTMPWHSLEFVVKDCDGRLLCFGSDLAGD
jgi:hypothetical protein